MTEAATRIGSYPVGARVDRGDTNEVYKATGPSGKGLAVKLYPEGESDAVRATRLKALQRVAKMDHANLVRVLDSGEHEGRVFAVMEFVKGTTLRQVMRHRRIPVRDGLAIIRAAAQGVTAAHRAGAAGVGLDPERILVSRDARTVKVLEPGMPSPALLTDPGRTVTVRSLDSIRYLAPEVAHQPDIDAPRADIYSLGVIAYETLTGKVPSGSFRLPSQVDSDIPSEVDQVLLKCLAPDPADRFSSVAALLDDVAELERTVPALQTGMLTINTGRGRDWRTILGAALLGAALILLLAARACGVL